MVSTCQDARMLIRTQLLIPQISRASEDNTVRQITSLPGLGDQARQALLRIPRRLCWSVSNSEH
jgi:hypothetical protein